jgi:hypothetical protein
LAEFSPPLSAVPDVTSRSTTHCRSDPRSPHGTEPLIRAFYGEEKIVIPIDPAVGVPWVPQARGSPGEQVLNNQRSNGKFLMQDRGPAFTRVSAVVSIKEELRDGSDGYWMDHNVLVAHNPFAALLVRDDIWGDVPQFVHREGEIAWTDGRTGPYRIAPSPTEASRSCFRSW